MDETEQSPELVVEDRSALVPKWLLEADVNDAAVRLYALLLRYGQTFGARMPSWATLARRMHKKSTGTIDRGLKALVRIGAVAVEHRHDGAQRLTNDYHVRTQRPGRIQPLTPTNRASRRSAATSAKSAGHGRKDEGRAAARSGQGPEHLTQSTSSSDAPGRRKTVRPVAQGEVATACGIEDWSAFIGKVQQTRRDVGTLVTRWSWPCLSAALQLAVRGRDRPADLAGDALCGVVADPASRSPMRVAEVAPWWDEPPTTQEALDANGTDLRAMEEALLQAGGVRIDLQLQTRRALEEAGIPVIGNAVVRGAHRLLRDHDTATATESSTGAAA